MNRSCGILLHITSLPSRYGIGTLGQAAYDWIDFLRLAGQRYWQILPTGPTGYGNSPYQSFSTFAGNPYFIDLDLLIQQGWLTHTDVASISWCRRPDQVDFPILSQQRLPLLHRAYETFFQSPPPDFSSFCQQEANWLDDYALFMALKSHYGNISWTQWDKSLQLREPAALTSCRVQLAEQMNFHRFLQYNFQIQWQQLRTYAREQGITIIGDLPIYVPLDSADCWCAPEQFQLNPNHRPKWVAGCPPDQFSPDGQYWGNPIYDWKRMEQDGFTWWLRRIDAVGRQFDVIRIDHFRGLESYWAIPATERTARHGNWVKGPGQRLIDTIRHNFPHLRFIAEDLGFLTNAVRKLVKESGFPGMKVLEFAFSSQEDNDNLPNHYVENCVCYTGTHDNVTLAQWCQESPSETLVCARNYLRLSPNDNLADAILRCGMASRAALFLAQFQDYLGLDGESRMNEPGTLKPENWRWRSTPEQYTEVLATALRRLAKTYHRIPKESPTFS